MDSCNKEGGPTSFFITESNVSNLKATSFYSTTGEEPESTLTEFGGQWAECTRPLIEEVEGDNPTKNEMHMGTVEVIEDLKAIATPQLHCVGDQSGIKLIIGFIGETLRGKVTLICH